MITWQFALKTCTELDEPIKGKSLQKVLKCRQQRASRLMSLLRSWNYLRYYIPNLRGYGGYVVTDSGKQLVQQWKDEEKDLTKGPKLYDKCKLCTEEDWRRRTREVQRD